MGYNASRRRRRLCYLGEEMKLADAIRDLNSLHDEETIYASKPWSEDSDVVIAPEPETRGLPAEAEKSGMHYFMEVFVAKEFLDGWISSLEREPTLKEQCARLIRYATTDA